MEQHLLLTDTEFEQQFETWSLDPTLFSHEAHLRLAWIHVTKYGVEQACDNVCEQILRFDIVHGKGDKFHKTLTVASVRAVHHFVQQSQSTTFPEFMQEFPRLKYNFKDLLGFHYGGEVLFSEQARMEYVEPDLLPFE